jgi:diguanylate cyclase (GGDEF)-like protein
VAAGVVLLTGTNTLLHVWSVEDLWPTCAVMLVLVGAGACISARLWSYGTIAVLDVAWILVTQLAMDPDPRWMQFLMQIGCATILGVVLNVIRHRTVARLEEAQRAVADMAVTDELTGLRNRRGLLLVGEPMLSESRRSGRPITVLYLDVDGLKQVNDNQGHAAGDRLIAGTGEVLKSVFRSAGVVARLGGDEFAILLTGTGETEVVLLQERLRSRLAENGVSASVGVVRSDPHQPDQSLEQLVDLSMYAVKRDRRAARPADLRAHTA